MFYNEFMPRPEYIEITCKSAVNRVQGMPYLKWSLNPYGGCVHRCRFCFAVQYRVVADQGTGAYAGRTGKVAMHGTSDASKYPNELTQDDFWAIRLDPQ